MKVLFSHIGLCGLVALYCAAGGFIFEHLEKANEEQICYDTYKEYMVMENDSLSKIQQLIEDYEGNSEKSTLKYQLQGILQIYRDNSINIGYEGSNCSSYGLVDGPKYKWSWPGAFFFSVTVVSTIGESKQNGVSVARNIVSLVLFVVSCFTFTSFLSYEFKSFY